MSRSQNTERVRALTKMHLEQAKKLDGLNLDYRALWRNVGQIADAVMKVSEQLAAVSEVLEHLEKSGQVKFPEHEPAPESGEKLPGTSEESAPTMEEMAEGVPYAP